MYGITSRYLRMLVENPWNGGRGYTPKEVGEMTPDQIYFCLCDATILNDRKGERVKKMKVASGGPLQVDESGRVVGMMEDGSQIRAKIEKHTLDSIRATQG